jgi:uncharacterized delta-60 repeat protein
LFGAAALGLTLNTQPASAQSPLPDSFNPGANEEVTSLAVQADGKILVGGGFTNLGGQARNYIGRLNADGTLDGGFNPGTGAVIDATVYSLAVQADGKILVGGGFTTLGGQPRNYIGRLTANGTLDSAFNPGANDRVNSLAVQPDGKILVVGNFTTLGGQTRNRIGRLNADGTLDSGFNPGANDRVYPLAVQADGKILVGGLFTTLGGQTRNRIARLNANGTLDSGFSPGANDRVYALAVQADGKILVSGWFTTLGGQTRTGIGRLNANGTLDTGFNPGAGYRVISLPVQADGKILLGGEFTTLGGQARSYIGRLNADGTLDSGFDPGAGGYVHSLAVQADGKILVGGPFTTLGGQPRSRIGRLNNSAPATQSLTFDGSTITWLRGGTSPEAWRTTFDLSTDGLTWSNLGAGTRIAGGWQLAVASSPPSGIIRGRGYVTGGVYNGTGWFVETQVSYLNPPTIVEDPRSVTNISGTTAMFTVNATGAPPLAYQWSKDGVALADSGNVFGARSSVLRLANVQWADAGQYTVVVTNVVGTAKSRVASLTVLILPEILTQPQNQAVALGANVLFSVSVSGTPPLSYQWRKNGENIVGETSSTLALGVAGSGSAGIYSVVVSDPYGSKTSAGAQLTVSSPLVLVETSLAPTVAMSTPAFLVSCLTSPSQLRTFVGGSFTTGGTLAPGKRTIVLTHGWIPAVGPVRLTGGIGGWPTEIAQTLVSHRVDANIVAWDWGCAARSFPCNPGKAAGETQIQGPALGQALSAALGANYSHEIHFIGSSLGTLVNAPAANYLHSHGFDWRKTHMTLFDEAEIATDTGCFQMFAYALYWSPSDTQDYRQPLPAQFFWADNYVSLVGRLQRKAANVILTNGLPSSAPGLPSFIAAATDFHGYPIAWYSNTIPSPMGAVMGFRWSFEEGGFVGAPVAGRVYVQAFNTSELDLVEKTYEEGNDLLNQRFHNHHTTVAMLLAETVAPGLRVGVVSGQAIYTQANQVNMRIDLWTSAAVGPLAPNRSPHPLDPGPDPASVTNVPAYVWIPITIPSNAVSMSFDFLLQGDGQSDSFAAALNGTNVVLVAANLIQTNVMLNSGSIDMSQYSGQQVELFLGIVGGTSTNAWITVTNLQFLGFMPPSLQAQLSGNNLVVTWPISEDGYALETSSSLTGTNSWAPVTNVTAIVDFQNAVTNQVSAGSRFYRLRKQ